MSRLSEIYKSEKTKGGGLFSTLGKRALEKIDPRQLFDQSGLLSAMAPKLFKQYSATGKTSDKTSSLKPVTETSLSDSKLDVIIGQNVDLITNSKITAKNSLIFPALARDMNVMRQNMVKMVKLQGGTPTTKADMFFKSSKEREAEYEVKFQKNRPASPTVSKDKPGGKGGLLGMLSGLLPAIISGIGTLGGKIISGITGAISGLGSLILQGISSALSIPNLMKAFGVVTEALGGILKLATMVATNPLFLAMASITGVAALLAFLRADYDKDKARYMNLALKKKEKGLLPENEQKELEKLERPNFRKESIRSFGFDPKTGKEVDKNITDEELNIQDKAARTKILLPGIAKDYLKAGEDFYKSEGYTKQQLELMAAGKKVDLTQPSGVTPVQPPAAPATAPAAPATAPATVSRSSSGRVTTTPATTAPASSTTPEGMQNYRTRAPAPTGTTPSQVPSTTPEGMQNSVPRVLPISGSNAILDMIASGEALGSDPYNSMNQGTPGGKISGSGISSKVIGKNLTDLTVGEILSRAPNAKETADQRKQKGAVFAAGRYQIIPETLQGLVNRGVVNKDEKFTPEVQDRLAISLVNQTGALKSIDEGDLEKAQYQLSKVWASLPVPAGMSLKSGEISTGKQSFYGGITANKAKEGLTLASLPGLGKPDTMTASAGKIPAPSVPPVTVMAASAEKVPAPSVVASVPSRPSSIISNSTLALAEVKEQTARAPVVVNAPQTVNNVQQGGSSGSIQLAAASVVDGEFMKLLVSRTL
jgi:hypothetical protein